MQSQSRRAEDGAGDGASKTLACDCEGPIKANCLNAIFISMAIEFLHNLAKQRLRQPARPRLTFPWYGAMCESASNTGA